MNTNGSLKCISWPPEVDIGFRRGVALTVALFLGFELWNWIIEYPKQMILSFSSNPVFRSVNTGIWVFLNLVILCVVVQRIGRINIRTLLLHTFPSLKQSIKWAIFGFSLSLFQFIYLLNQSYDFESSLNMWGVTFTLIAVSGVIVPILEEILFRGILFVALKKKGRAIAYIFSVFWFVFNHIPSYSNLFFHGIIGLTFFHFVFLILMGIITGYIYESTGNLLLCVIFHGASNATPLLSRFLNYLINQ